MQTKKLSHIFKALSDENRLKILLFIQKSEKKLKKHHPRKKRNIIKISRKINKNNKKSNIPPGICLKDITQKFNLTLPTISHHIKKLIYADLIKTEKVGRWVYCRVDKKKIKDIQKIIKKLN